MNYHLRLYHATKWDDSTIKGWYTRVNEKLSYEYEPLMTLSGPIVAPYALAIFIVPPMCRVDKLPKKGMHLKPFGQAILPRTQDLLQATRGLLLFSNYFEPSELLTPEGMGYWLGYHHQNFRRHYQFAALVAMIYNGMHNVPQEYYDGMTDFLMQRSL